MSNVETTKTGALRIWGDFPAARVTSTQSGYNGRIVWDESRGFIGRSRGVFDHRFDAGENVIEAAWRARENLADRQVEYAKREHDAGREDAESYAMHREHAESLRDRSAVVCVVSSAVPGEHVVTFISRHIIAG